MTTRCLPRLSRACVLVAASAGVFLAPPSLLAQKKRKDPASKLYVTDVGGDAVIDTGETIEELNKRSVHDAQGTVIETKKVEKVEDEAKAFSTMVFSNGTGAYFGEDTRVEVKKFVQEPFTPNRNDYDVEPSISQTQAFVARGTVGLCTSKLVAGSNMNYATPHGSVNIRGRKVVIEATPEETKISMLEGDSTVRAGEKDLAGYTLHVGEQAIIRRPTPTSPPQVQIQRIPQSEQGALDDKVNTACNAKKTVYFEVRERPADKSSDNTTVGDDVTPGGNSGPGGDDNSSTSNRGGSPNNGVITAFDGAPGSGPGGTGSVIREIVAVPVTPVELPVQYTVSPASLTTPRPPNG
jgi:hypothetical protein